jgi:hypothetical protein
VLLVQAPKVAQIATGIAARATEKAECSASSELAAIQAKLEQKRAQLVTLEKSMEEAKVNIQTVILCHNSRRSASQDKRKQLDKTIQDTINNLVRKLQDARPADTPILAEFDSVNVTAKPRLWQESEMVSYRKYIDHRVELDEAVKFEKQAITRWKAKCDVIAYWEDFHDVLFQTMHTDKRQSTTPLRTPWGEVLAEQLRLMEHETRRPKFPQAIIQPALAIYNRSPSGYRACEIIEPSLPDPATLRRARSNCSAGDAINQQSIHRHVKIALLMELGLGSKVDPFNGYIVTDDVGTASAAKVNRRTGATVGLSSDVEPSSRISPEQLKKVQETGDFSSMGHVLGDQVSQFMYVSLDYKYRFLIGHYYSRQDDTDRLSRQVTWLLDWIHVLHANGFHIWALVSDQHATNVSTKQAFVNAANVSTEDAAGVALRHAEGESGCVKQHFTPEFVRTEATSTRSQSSGPKLAFDSEMLKCSCPHPCEPTGYRFFFIPDNEHLLKTLRNNFANTWVKESKPKPRTSTATAGQSGASVSGNAGETGDDTDTPDVDVESDSESGSGSDEDEPPDGGSGSTATQAKRKRERNPRKLYARVQNADGSMRDVQAFWNHIATIFRFDEKMSKNGKAPRVAHLLTVDAVYLDTWTKMVMTLFDRTMNFNTAEAIEKLAKDIEELRSKGCDVPELADVAATVRLIRDIATVGLYGRSSRRKGAWGYSSPNDRRLVEMQAIYGRLKDETEYFRDKLCPRDSGLAIRDAKNWKRERKSVGFADNTLESFRSFLGGFRGLLHQYKADCEYRKVKPRSLPVPTQKPLEGEFGKARMKTTVAHMSCGVYTGLQATETSKQEADVTASTWGLLRDSQDETKKAEFHRIVNCTWGRAASAEMYCQWRPGDVPGVEDDSDQDADLATGTDYMDVKQAQKLVALLNDRISPLAKTKATMTAALEGFNSGPKARQLLAFMRCAVTTVTAAFHHFMHPLKGKKFVVRHGDARRKRVKAYLAFALQTIVLRARDRWREHIPFVKDGRTSTSAALSGEEKVLAVCLASQIFRDVVLPLVDKRKWTNSEVPERRLLKQPARQTAGAPLPAVVSDECAGGGQRLLLSSISGFCKAPVAQAEEVRDDAPLHSAADKSAYLSGWEFLAASKHCLKYGHTEAFKLLAFLTTSMMTFLPSTVRAKPNERLYRPTDTVVSFHKHLMEWVRETIRTNILQNSRGLLNQLSVSARCSSELRAAWAPVAAEAATRAGKAFSVGAVLMALQKVVYKALMWRYYEQLRNSRMLNTNSAAQATRSVLRSQRFTNTPPSSRSLKLVEAALKARQQPQASSSAAVEATPSGDINESAPTARHDHSTRARNLIRKQLDMNVSGNPAPQKRTKPNE